MANGGKKRVGKNTADSLMFLAYLVRSRTGGLPAGGSLLFSKLSQHDTCQPGFHRFLAHVLAGTHLLAGQRNWNLQWNQSGPGGENSYQPRSPHGCLVRIIPGDIAVTKCCQAFCQRPCAHHHDFQRVHGTGAFRETSSAHQSRFQLPAQWSFSSSGFLISFRPLTHASLWHAVCFMC